MNALVDSRPTLSVCIIARNCAADLERCLKSVRARAPGAQIVVVDTMSNDYAPEGLGEQRIVPQTVAIAQIYADVVEEYAGPEGTWTREMYAFDDAAAARNRSFALATGKWVMWIDADDELVGPEEAERLLKVNGRWKPGVASSKMDAAKAQPISLEMLLELVAMNPEAKNLTAFFAPYLYRFQDGADGEAGIAMTWQTRERIVRNDGTWHWQRKAHEVLVPKDAKAKRETGSLAHLLFVHRKVWNDEAAKYSMFRHNAILEKDYAAGVRNCQDILYMENYATFIGTVERRRELIEAGLACAYTPVDRARVLIRQASLAEENGYFHECVGAYAAAIEVDPNFPDPYFRLAQTYERAEQWMKAVEWYERGVAVPSAHLYSDVTPRDHLVNMRGSAAVCAHRASQLALRAGNLNLAELYATKAVAFMQAALAEPSLGPDKVEAVQWLGLFENERDALLCAKQLHAIWHYLKSNDETLKAATVLKLVPHNLKDHPIFAEMEKWADKLYEHLKNPDAYQEFYEAIGTDITSNADDENLVLLPRCRFAIAQLQALQKRLGRPLRILEVGPFDGITAIPIMRALPDCEFVGLEIKDDAVKRLRERIAALKLPNKADIIHGQLKDARTKLYDESRFDAAIFFEVIEHVDDPVKAVGEFEALVRSEGLLLVSTPWGAFDRGHQPMADTRDQRGHVRAMTADELVTAIEAEASFIVETQDGCHAPGNYGDTLHLAARRLSHHETVRRCAEYSPDISFVVPSALWDWNASTLIGTGMGASEETIVFLARELAEDEANKVRVYGPIPRKWGLNEEEVNAAVQYLSRDSVRQVRSLKGPVVVSRAPSYGTTLPVDDGRRILWLQDAQYPDLNAEVAARYKTIVVLTQWHKQVIHEFCDVPLDKMVIAPNFLLREHFDVERVKLANEARARALADGAPCFLYASSPDRGLIELLKVWKHVIKEWPKATLRIFYGWEGCMKLAGNDAGWNSRYKAIREEYLKLHMQPGIIEVGRVNHATIADEYRRAHVWPYVTAFGETFCSNAIKARAAGCVPVASPVAALAETAACDQTVFVDYKLDTEAEGDFLWRYFEGIKSALLTSDEARLAMADRSINQYELAAVLPVWKRILGV